MNLFRWLQRGEPVTNRLGGRSAAFALLWPWGALGEANTEDIDRLGNTAREPWPGAAPVRVAPPAEGRLRGREVNPREVGRQPWPVFSPGAPWERSITGGRESAVRVVGEDRRGAGSGRQGESFVATKDVSLSPRSAGPGGGRVFTPWAQEGRQRGAWLRWIAAADPRGTKLPGSPPRGPQPSFAAFLGLQGSFLTLFFRHRLCLLAGVALVSEMVPERRVFSIPERGGPRLHHEL